MVTEIMAFDINMDSTQIAAYRERGAHLESTQIEAYAKQDAQYFAQVFEEEGTDIAAVIYFLTKCRLEYSKFFAGFTAYITILRYFRNAGRGLPAHYFDVATNDGAFSLYCKHLICYLSCLA